MFHCYRPSKRSDSTGLMPRRASMVSLISTRSNYSSVLTMEGMDIASLVKWMNPRRTSDITEYRTKNYDDSLCSPIPSISINVPLLCPSDYSSITVSYSIRKGPLCIEDAYSDQNERTVTENSINDLKCLSEKKQRVPHVRDKLTGDVHAGCDKDMESHFVKEVPEITGDDASVSLDTMGQSTLLHSEQCCKIKSVWTRMSAKILDCNCFKVRPALSPDDY